MRLRNQVGVPLLLLMGSSLPAQQVRFVDITTTTQRVELRFPPAPPIENGYGGGYGGVSIAECGTDSRDPRSLTVYLQSVIPTDSDAKRPFEIEFKVLNTGQVALQLPVSPHLSDLQPSDASVAFTYRSLALAVSPAEDRGSSGYVELYGKPGVPDTLITLNPGEWIRVEARVDFHLNVPPAGTINLEPGYWLRQVRFHPHPGGFSTAHENICINHKPMPTVLVHRN
jgi:hypothetical protein